MKTNLELIFGPNTKLRVALLVTTACVLILNFPALTDWLPPEWKTKVVTAAWAEVQAAILFALGWAKQHNVSGLGTPEAPAMKPDAEQQTRIL